MLLYCQAYDHNRAKEKFETIRNFIAGIATQSKEGHKLFQDFLDSYNEVIDMADLKESLSEGMKAFLGLKVVANNGEDE